MQVLSVTMLSQSEGIRKETKRTTSREATPFIWQGSISMRSDTPPTRKGARYCSHPQTDRLPLKSRQKGCPALLWVTVSFLQSVGKEARTAVISCFSSSFSIRLALALPPFHSTSRKRSNGSLYKIQLSSRTQARWQTCDLSQQLLRLVFIVVSRFLPAECFQILRYSFLP